MKNLTGLTKKIVMLTLVFSFILSFGCKKNVSGSEAKATLSSNNYLKYIGFSSKVNGFKFEPKEQSYSVKLLNENTETIAVNAFAQDEKAKVSITPSGNVNIEAGDSVNFTITCTAQNGATREVKVEVRRGRKGGGTQSNNAFLKSVKFSSGSLLQEFKKNKLDGYTVHLGMSEGSTRVLVLPEDERATITYTPSSKIEVSEGEEKDCTVTCIAEDGTTKKEYKFKISRESSSELPSLIDIVVGKGETLSPSFKKDHLNYSCLVASHVSNVSVQGIPLNKNASVQVNPSGNVSLTPNVETTFTIKVSLPSKPSEFTTYTVKVKRDVVKDADASLRNLTLTGNDGVPFALSPNFNTGVKEYEANVYKNFDGVLNLVGTPTSSAATTRVFCTPTSLGANVGDKMTMQCIVTAQAGNQETYTVVATRSSDEKLSKDATLKSLALLGQGTPIALSPAFASNTVNYTATVPFHFNKKIKARYEVNHRKATAIDSAVPEDLPATSNATQTITVTVTAEDTSVTKNYVITVTRETASDDADLEYLKLKRDNDSDDVELTPPFAPNITEYKATVPITTAKVRFVWERKVATSSTNPEHPMNPVTYTPHTPENPFPLSITVTAQSGATKTYTVKISSPAFNDPITMVTVISGETTVTGAGNEGVFVQGRTVKIAPYKMSETEIPFVVYKQVLDWAKKNGFGFSISTVVKKGSQDENEEEPACGVKWAEAVLWCNAYSKMKGKEPCYTKADGSPLTSYADVDNTIKMDMSKNGYRLPTEVEWEFAARGGRPTEPAWNYKWAGVDGDLSFNPPATAPNPAEVKKIGEFVWHWGNSKVDGSPKTQKPKLKKPTNHDKDDTYPKIYDLSGNVAEWVWDSVGNITASTPVTGNSPSSPMDKSKRLFRGGWCFNLQGKNVKEELNRCMVTDRTGSYTVKHKMPSNVGFRIVCKN